MLKKKKNVPPVEAETPEKDDSVATPQDVPEEQAETSDVPAMPFDLSKIDPAKIKLAEDMGIPITELINWAMSVEKRFQLIARDVANAPDRVVEALKAEAVKAQGERVQQMQQQQGGREQSTGGISGALRAAREMGIISSGGGGGVDEEMQNLMKDMYRLNLARMKQDMENSMMRAKSDSELSQDIGAALKAEFAKKAAKKLLE